MQDCTEVCSVYSIVVSPVFGYIQGMMDYCLALKMGDEEVTNAQALKGVATIVERIAQLSVDDLTERSFVLAQLYIHMYEELHALERPSVFALISEAFVLREQLLPGHQLGAAFQTFFLSAGFRGNPKRVTKPELVPVIDFVLRHGRPGVIALLFSGLDLNRPAMESLLAVGKHGEAARFVADPFADGGFATVPELVSGAEAYMRSNVGSMPFASAVGTMDQLAEQFVPKLGRPE